jgi:hypothetical protein
MKVVVLGTRGIPDIPGGVETHCQALYPRLVRLGHDVELVTRKPYVADTSANRFRGVRLKHLYASGKKSLEAIVHTFLGICYARIFPYLRIAGPHYKLLEQLWSVSVSGKTDTTRDYQCAGGSGYSGLR